MSVRTARDVMLTGEQHNVVSLSLEAVNLLYSRIYRRTIKNHPQRDVAPSAAVL